MSRTTRSRNLVAAAVAASLLFAACGDDDADTTAAGADTQETTTTEPPPADNTSVEEGADDSGEPAVVAVEAVDFAFQGLPDVVPAGTKLTFTNRSDVELHELVAMRIPDGETRSVEELLALPEEELMTLFTGPPAAVLMAPPGGGEQIAALGDGTLAEPGRYAILCFIPTGADPVAYLEQSGPDGPPQVEGGPPHVVHGMHAELIVE